MAVSAPRVCTAAGCGVLVRTGGTRCPRHPHPVFRRERTQGDRDYDRRRGTAAERGYDSAWTKLRRLVLANEPLCRHCKRRGRVEPATEVDHIIPVPEAPERRLDESNLQPLCHPCHVRKTAQDRRSRRGPQTPREGR